MSYSAFEQSVDRGEPVEVYLFEVADQKFIGLTNWDRDTDLPETENRPRILCKRSTIERDKIEANSALESSSFSIRTSRSEPIAQRIMSAQSDNVIFLTIYRFHAGDPVREMQQIWFGRALGVSFQGIEAEITCDPYSTKASRSGLTRNYGYACGHALYDPSPGSCRALKKKYLSTVTTVTGSVVALTPVAGPLTPPMIVPLPLDVPQHFVGGYAEWVEDDERKISRIVGVTVGSGVLNVTLVGSLPALTAEITAYKGCDRTEEACIAVHDNVVNFGGFKWIPTKNPIGKISTFY